MNRKTVPIHSSKIVPQSPPIVGIRQFDRSKERSFGFYMQFLVLQSGVRAEENREDKLSLFRSAVNPLFLDVYGKIEELLTSFEPV